MELQASYRHARASLRTKESDLRAYDNGTIVKREISSYFWFNNQRSNQALGDRHAGGAVSHILDGAQEGIDGVEVIRTTDVSITCTSRGTLT